MKTATYRGVDGRAFTVEYDEAAPCRSCNQPVGEASMGGTDVCPACDCGCCRYCGVTVFALKESIDGGSSLRRLREHVAYCKGQHERSSTWTVESPRADHER